MNVRPARLPRTVAAAVLALALPLAACAGTDGGATASSAAPASPSSGAQDDTPQDAAPRAGAGQRIEVAVAGGQVTGDTGRVPVPVGTQVTLVITSDVEDEVHVHGYDLAADLNPGTPAEIRFTATVPGVFEVELHDAGTVLLSLQVS